jgi:hypothetical protein
MVVAVPSPQETSRPALRIVGKRLVRKRSGKRHEDPIVGIARSLAREIADAADADQWAIAVVGVPQLGAPDFEERVPREWLELLNDHRPARYRITLVLQTAERDLGILRLGTIRPAGFSVLEIARAREAAEQASERLAAAMAGGGPACPRVKPRERYAAANR